MENYSFLRVLSYVTVKENSVHDVENQFCTIKNITFLSCARMFMTTCLVRAAVATHLDDHSASHLCSSRWKVMSFFTEKNKNSPHRTLHCTQDAGLTPLPLSTIT